MANISHSLLIIILLTSTSCTLGSKSKGDSDKNNKNSSTKLDTDSEKPIVDFITHNPYNYNGSNSNTRLFQQSSLGFIPNYPNSILPHFFSPTSPHPLPGALNYGPPPLSLPHGLYPGENNNFGGGINNNGVGLGLGLDIQSLSHQEKRILLQKLIHQQQQQQQQQQHLNPITKSHFFNPFGPQHPQHPPQIPPQIPHSVLGGNHYLHGHSLFNHHNPHPGHSNSINDGFDWGNHFGLPKQVRVPGEIGIRLDGVDAEISCEFPRYLILAQNIYWHHKYDDPYGSFFDSQNGFGPRITITNINQWRSVLRIRNFDQYDQGIYRCMSAAILPEEGQLPGPPTLRNNHHHAASTLNPSSPLPTPAAASSSSSSTLPDDDEFPYKFDSERESKLKSSLFYMGKNKKSKEGRKIRFTRELRRERGGKNEQGENAQVELTKSSSVLFANEVYDPFISSGKQGQSSSDEISSRSFYNFRPNNNLDHLQLQQQQQQLPYGGQINSLNYGPINQQNGYLNNHLNNYLNSQGNKHFLPPPPFTPNPWANPHLSHLQNHHGQGHGQFTPTPNPFGLNAPYYKPKYSLYTVYQEINFAPQNYNRVDPSAAASTSPTSRRGRG